MGAKVIQTIRRHAQQLSRVNERALSGQAQQISQALGELKGRTYNKSVIIRQWPRETDDVVRTSMLEQFYFLWAATAFTSRLRGDILIDEVRSWPSLQRGVTHSAFAPDEWLVQEQLAELSIELGRACRSGDAIEIRYVAAQIRQKADQLASCAFLASAGRREGAAVR